MCNYRTKLFVSEYINKFSEQLKNAKIHRTRRSKTEMVLIPHSWRTTPMQHTSSKQTIKKETFFFSKNDHHDVFECNQCLQKVLLDWLRTIGCRFKEQNKEKERRWRGNFGPFYGIRLVILKNTNAILFLPVVILFALAAGCWPWYDDKVVRGGVNL